MPTRDRSIFAAQAIEYFLRQDYAERELVIVDDGKDSIADLVPRDDRRIRYFRQDKQVTLDSNLPTDMQAELNHLSNLHGSQFDDAYRNSQITGHKQATDVFKKEIENGRDDLVKAYAVKMLPDIELHCKLAIAKQSETGATTKADHGI